MIIKMAQIVVCSYHVTSDTSQTIHAITSYSIMIALLHMYTCIHKAVSDVVHSSSKSRVQVHAHPRV